MNNLEVNLQESGGSKQPSSADLAAALAALAALAAAAGFLLLMTATSGEVMQNIRGSTLA